MGASLLALAKSIYYLRSSLRLNKLPSSTVTVPAILVRESYAQWVAWNGGPKGLSTDSSPFPLLAIFLAFPQTESLFTGYFGVWLGAHQHGIAVDNTGACVREDFLIKSPSLLISGSGSWPQKT